MGETWDREMAHIVGDVMSYEARFYSKDNPWKALVLWAPNADLARDPEPRDALSHDRHNLLIDGHQGHGVVQPLLLGQLRVLERVLRLSKNLHGA